MTAAEQYDAGLAAIEVRRAVIAAGTPGPWEARPTLTKTVCNDCWGAPNHWFAMVAPIDNPYGSLFLDGPRGHDKDAAVGDSVLIAAAVNAFAADTDALAAVLERHRPDGPFCLACGTVKTRYFWRSCPDARAALTALGVTDD